MNPGFECRVTASLLDSGRVLAQVSNCAALIGAVGFLLAQSNIARLAFVAPVLFWPGACYFALRVTIDASLFKEWGLEREGRCQALDELLHTWGLSRGTRERTLADRNRGALKLWNRLIAVIAVQPSTVLAGIVIQASAR